MVDIAFLAVPLLVAAVVMVRKTSAGVAVLGLLAGVMLDQLLTTWILDELPSAATSVSQYVPLGIRLVVTLLPAVVSLLAVKIYRHNAALSLLSSLMLGFLSVYFTLQILEAIPEIAAAVRRAGLLMFIRPYHNEIIAASALLAVAEMIFSHKSKPSSRTGKKKNHS